jgi:hypothetical protein
MPNPSAFFRSGRDGVLSSTGPAFDRCMDGTHTHLTHPTRRQTIQRHSRRSPASRSSLNLCPTRCYADHPLYVEQQPKETPEPRMITRFVQCGCKAGTKRSPVQVGQTSSELSSILCLGCQLGRYRTSSIDTNLPPTSPSVLDSSQTSLTSSSLTNRPAALSNGTFLLILSPSLSLSLPLFPWTVD